MTVEEDYPRMSELSLILILQGIERPPRYGVDVDA
jgi:hypothetical protein